MRLLAKALLVVATVLCGLSIGGLMMVAAPVLVPLHWRAGRDSDGWAVGGWAVLASASVFEWTWMWTFVVTGAEVPSVVAGLVAFALTGALFLRGAADRHDRRAIA